jgi:hypothetical protein
VFAQAFTEADLAVAPRAGVLRPEDRTDRTMMQLGEEAGDLGCTTYPRPLEQSEEVNGYSWGNWPPQAAHDALAS